MGLPNVSITITKGGLGKVNPTADAVAGMVCSGVTTTGYAALGAAVQLFSLDDLIALGFMGLLSMTLFLTLNTGNSHMATSPPGT